ncbi:MAG TPA: type II secretion system protein, partial [Chthonomonadales bacterium]|nr:type II secretion system protein [Chthonomonadales bacterium]
MSSRSRRPARSGFSLVEMVVASLLLAIAVAGALEAFSAATRAEDAGSRLQTAAMLANRRIAELELHPQELTPGTEHGSFGAEFPQYQWDQQVASTDYDGLLKVRVRVTWGAGQGSARLVTTYLQSSTGQSGQNSSTNGPGA